MLVTGGEPSELKSKPLTTKTRQAQSKTTLEKWRSAGAVVMVAYSKLSVMTLVKYIDTNQTGEWVFPEENGCVSWVRIPSLK